MKIPFLIGETVVIGTSFINLCTIAMSAEKPVYYLDGESLTPEMVSACGVYLRIVDGAWLPKVQVGSK